MTPEQRIRPLNLSTDLNRVADLVETCFPIQHDPDGQTYIREMRKAAREYKYLGWLPQVDEIRKNGPAGFVWAEGDQVIGNLSIIPFRSGGKKYFLLANVAVHPKHRRKGIARALTIRTLAHLRKHEKGEVWLQVRHDNQPAVELYRSAGFIEQFTRTTWRIRPKQLKDASVNPSFQMTLKRAHEGDWEKQQHYLALAYPREMRWNLTINFNRFKPGLSQWITNFLDGVILRRWGIEDQGRVFGWIVWQRTDAFADNLWLAIREDLETQILPETFKQVFLRLNKRHTVSLDYPYGRFEEGFQKLGFDRFRSLIWMRQGLN